MNNKPWGKQKGLQEETIPTANDIIIMAEGIPDAQTRALFVITYLTAGRMQEIVRYKGFDIKRFCPLCDSDKVIKIDKSLSCEQCGAKFKSKDTRAIKIPNGKDKPGLCKKDMSLREIDGRKIWLISLRNEKNRTKKLKEIPIPLDRSENVALYNLTCEYLTSLDLIDELFDYGYQSAYNRLKKFFNPHFFRHIRLTHLSLNYDLNEHLLRKYAGWTDGRPAQYYTEIKWKDLLNKL